jgi:hypothetical protein
VVIVAQCIHNLEQTENLHHVSSENYKMLTEAFVMKTLVKHNPLDCIHVSEVTKCQLRLLKVQVVGCKVGSIKTWKACMTASMRIVSMHLTMLLTF